MKVNTKDINPALESLFTDCKQSIFLDANLLIVPDRSRVGAKRVAFDKYQEYWLIPLFNEFPNLSVHETVYDELIDGQGKRFVDEMIAENPSRLRVYSDCKLTAIEKTLLEFQIQKIAPYSGYIPERDNSKDRGEIRSLAYMAVKNYLYFAANDNLAMQLINKAEELETGLEQVGLIQPYEILYYLHKTGKYEDKGLKMLYKYQYYLTGPEKMQNPDWGTFLEEMDTLYLL